MYFFTLKIDYNSNDKDRLLKNANWYSADSDPVGPRWSLKVHISSGIWDVPAILVDMSHWILPWALWSGCWGVPLGRERNNLTLQRSRVSQNMAQLFQEKFEIQN